MFSGTTNPPDPPKAPAPMIDSLAIMEQEIQAQRDLFVKGLPELFESARRAVASMSSLRRVVVTGCGDSGIASAVGQEFAPGDSSCPFLGVAPLDLLRGREVLGPGDLLVPISVTGRSAATIATARIAARGHAKSLALTAVADSSLAQACDRVLLLGGADSVCEPRPGVLSYARSLLGLAAIAEGLSAEGAPGRGSDGAAIPRADFRALADGFDGWVNLCHGFAERVLEGGFRRAHWLVTPRNSTTGRYAQMKCWETAGIDTLVCDPEEWAHGAFFATGAGVAVVGWLEGPEDEGDFLPAMRAARAVGGTSFLISPRPVSSGSDPEIPILVPREPLPDRLSPFWNVVPAQVLALHWGRRLDRAAFGFQDERRKKINFDTIYRGGDEA